MKRELIEITAVAVILSCVLLLLLLPNIMKPTPVPHGTFPLPTCASISVQLGDHYVTLPVAPVGTVTSIQVGPNSGEHSGEVMMYTCMRTMLKWERPGDPR